MKGKSFSIFLVILIVMAGLLIAGYIFSNNRNSNDYNTEILANENKNETRDCILYFSNDQANYLTKETRKLEIKNEEDLPMLLLKELIKGPENKELSDVIHKDTVINSVKVENKIATVDFSADSIILNTGGSTKETMFLYSIVNTLCELPEIDKVNFSKDGKLLETFGQFDMSEPYTKNLSLINK